MGAPLRVLGLSGEGGLLLPEPADVLRMCPEAGQEPIAAQFAQWRAKYPKSTADHDTTGTAEGVSAETATAGAGAADGALAAASAAIKAGAIVEGQQHVEKSLGETIVKQENCRQCKGPCTTSSSWCCVRSPVVPIGLGLRMCRSNHLLCPRGPIWDRPAPVLSSAS